MRSLERNKKTFYYALYQGKTEVIDSFGNKTGQYTLTYSSPEEYKANISPANGTTDLEQFGQNTNYSMVISTSDMECPFNETTHLWIGIPTSSPFNYVIVRRAESINNLSFAIREVETSGNSN